MEDCMPTSPTTVGREFVRRYYIIMNQSPENLHCFFSEDASFVHDDIDSTERQTITADGKMGIRDVMLARTRKYKHTATKVTTVDTVETLHDGLIIQVNGEISYNEQPLRPFSQTIILVRTSPFQFYVQNDIFRFCDMDFDVDNIGSDTVSDQTKPPAEDWGTQCEEYIEPSEAQSNSTQTEPRAGISRNDTDRDAQRNEVKLDTSDSGLSSDAEKAIMDMQSLNLKSILQEPRTNTKNAAMKSAPAPPETEPPTEAEVQTGDDGNRSQLFRDSCILTVGKVINPTIEFGYAKCDENTTSDNEKTQDSVDTLNTIGNDENNTGKIRYRKRKDKRRAKNEKGVFFDESNKEKEANQPSTDNRSDHSTVSADESPLTESKVEEPTDNPTEPESLKEMERETKEETSKPTEQEPPKDTEFEQGTPKEVEQETPKTAVQRKTYADLAKAGSSEWVDELASRRDFNIVAEKSKSRPPLPRRSSRSEKTTPPNDGGKSSPKNDQLQVFVGNIPHTASEEDIRKMFSRFGRLSRLRLHANSRKDWLPRYAFITYETVQSVRSCLMKKHTFYWPENSHDAAKLNVNGDPSVDVWDDAGNRKTSDTHAGMRDSSKNFSSESKESSKKRS